MFYKVFKIKSYFTFKPFLNIVLIFKLTTVYIVCVPPLTEESHRLNSIKSVQENICDT